MTKEVLELWLTREDVALERQVNDVAQLCAIEVRRFFVEEEQGRPGAVHAHIVCSVAAGRSLLARGWSDSAQAIAVALETDGAGGVSDASGAGGFATRLQWQGTSLVLPQEATLLASILGRQELQAGIVLVTGTSGGAGASTLAWGLARAFASSGARVACVNMAFNGGSFLASLRQAGQGIAEGETLGDLDVGGGLELAAGAGMGVGMGGGGGGADAGSGATVRALRQVAWDDFLDTRGQVLGARLLSSLPVCAGVSVLDSVLGSCVVPSPPSQHSALFALATQVDALVIDGGARPGRLPPALAQGSWGARRGRVVAVGRDVRAHSGLLAIYEARELLDSWPTTFVAHRRGRGLGDMDVKSHLRSLGVAANVSGVSWRGSVARDLGARGLEALPSRGAWARSVQGIANSYWDLWRRQ